MSRNVASILTVADYMKIQYLCKTRQQLTMQQKGQWLWKYHTRLLQHVGNAGGCKEI